MESASSSHTHKTAEILLTQEIMRNENLLREVIKIQRIKTWKSKTENEAEPKRCCTDVAASEREKYMYLYIYYIYSIIVVRESGKVDDLWQSRGVVGDKEKAEAASLAAHFPPFKFQLLGRQRKVIIVNGLLA